MAKRKKARSASPMAGGENDRAMRVARLRAPTIIERDRVFYPLVIALGVIVPAIGAFLLFREGAPSLGRPRPQEKPRRPPRRDVFRPRHHCPRLSRESNVHP